MFFPSKQSKYAQQLYMATQFEMEKKIATLRPLFQHLYNYSVSWQENNKDQWDTPHKEGLSRHLSTLYNTDDNQSEIQCHII